MKTQLMWKLGLLILLCFSIPQARASTEMISCFNTQDSARELVAVIVDRELRAVRFQTQNSLPRQYPVTKLGTQEFPGQTIYSLTFTDLLIIADNSLLIEQTGHLVINGRTWSCN